MNNEGFVRCSSPSHDQLRQDNVLAGNHTGQITEHTVDGDTAPFTKTTTSDLPPTSSTPAEHSTSFTKATLLYLEQESDVVLTSGANMGRVNKRAYRQGHQTREFFDYQPTRDQESSDGNSNPSTMMTGVDRHRALVKGTVEGCSGASCADCKEGRSAPIQDQVSTSVPGKCYIFLDCHSIVAPPCSAC